MCRSDEVFFFFVCSHYLFIFLCKWISQKTKGLICKLMDWSFSEMLEAQPTALQSYPKCPERRSTLRRWRKKMLQSSVLSTSTITWPPIRRRKSSHISSTNSSLFGKSGNATKIDLLSSAKTFSFFFLYHLVVFIIFLPFVTCEKFKTMNFVQLCSST